MKNGLLNGLVLFIMTFGFAACSQPGSPGPGSPGGSGSGSGSATVYAAGYCLASSGQVAGYWKNGQWTTLSNPSGYPAAVTALVVSGTDICPAGWAWSGSSSNTQMPGYWLKGVWTSLGGSGSYGAVTTSLALPPNDVYAGGYYWTLNSYGLVQLPGYWSTSSWVGLSTQSIYGASVTSMLVSAGHTYAGGWRTAVASTNPVVFYAYPGYWMDGFWTPLPDSGQGGSVNSLAASADGTIYAGGSLAMGYDLQNPQTALSEAGYWQGSLWTPLTSAAPGSNRVIAIAVSGTDIYSLGYSSSVPGYWKNTGWTPLPPQATVTSLAVSGSDAYVGGTNGSGGAGYWTNGSWNGLTPTSGTTGGQVTAIAVTQ